MNRIKVGGNLGANIDLRSTSNGTPVASARLATGKKFTDRSGTELSRPRISRRVRASRSTAS